MNEQQYFLGLDLGQSKDYTALAIVEMIYPQTPASLPWRRRQPDPEPVRQVRHLQRWKLRTPYPAIVKDVKEMLNRAPLLDADTVLSLDNTGVGAPVTDLFWNADLNTLLKPVQIVGGHKESYDQGVYYVPKRVLVSHVQVGLQSGTLKIAADMENAQTLVSELQNFQVKITDAANDVYGAWRENEHDDLVLAIALALWSSQHGGGRVQHGPSLWSL